ncbi:MAG: zinc-ribbon domain-containing protein [Lachnospiraceae bacterium]|nr:zinc-ribbon domain-containing protein [Lachnospiraceae bacterium]
MNCPSCGSPISDDAKFCTICGASIPAGTAAPVNNAMPANNGTPMMQPMNNGMPMMQQNQGYNPGMNQSFQQNAPMNNGMDNMAMGFNGSWNNNSYAGTTGSFINEGEVVVASMRNGIGSNILSGEGIMNEDCILTNERIYYNARRGIVSVTSVNERVDIKDVTGTKIVTFANWWFVILSVIFFIAGLALIGPMDGWSCAVFLPIALIELIVFFLTKKKHIFIEYAGGNMHFSVKKFSFANVQNFQSEIYRQKTKLEKAAKENKDK